MLKQHFQPSVVDFRPNKTHAPFTKPNTIPSIEQAMSNNNKIRKDIIVPVVF
jgi:hypothetical protein